MDSRNITTRDALRHLGAKNIAAALLLIILIASVIIAGCTSLYTSVKEGILLRGELNAKQAAEEFDKYVLTRKITVMLDAFTVDRMMNDGKSELDIFHYMEDETVRIKADIDESCTGLYGLVQERYIDGGGWVPDKHYKPKERPWYQAAVSRKERITLVAPYLDAETGSVMITISGLLSDGTSVIALDFGLDPLQELTQRIYGTERNGFGMVLDQTGDVVVHTDSEELGHHYMRENDSLGHLVAEQILAHGLRQFEVNQKGSTYVVYAELIDGGWYSVSVINADAVYAPLRLIGALSVLAVALTVVGLWIIFIRMSKRNLRELLEEEEHSRQLHEAKTAAEQANAAKSDFLASMSHEIRTPIHAVLGMDEMILREAAKGPDGESLENIRTSAQGIASAGNHLLSLINDVLDISRIENGKLTLVNASYQLSGVLRDVCNMVALKARAKGLEFRAEVDETLPETLFGDETHLRQAITNLLSNAVKYTRQGSVTLTIQGQRSPEQLEQGEITLLVSIRDTGSGIREEDLPKLFTKFERVDLEHNSTVEGTGLGLVITKSLAEMMGGSVGVESRYGEGSVFTLTIPQRIVSDKPMGDYRIGARESLSGEAETEHVCAPEARILIVDDTRMNLTVAVGLLRDTRIQIDTAESGFEAMEKAKNTPYDLILMDQRMPCMDGTQTLHGIRTQEGGANRETPVLCLTADAVAGARERYLSEGFVDYLTKPVNGERLESALLRYLPPEKVQRTSTEAQREKAVETVPETRRFADADRALLCPEDGLRYCRNDEELYLSLLREYARGGREKRANLEQFYAAEDWQNYAILVHALKSSSRMIGAGELSQHAARLEAAANTGDIRTLDQGHQRLMEQYDAVLGTISACLPDAEQRSGEDRTCPAGEGEEVLEFQPGQEEVMEFLPEED